GLSKRLIRIAWLRQRHQLFYRWQPAFNRRPRFLRFPSFVIEHFEHAALRLDLVPQHIINAHSQLLPLPDGSTAAAVSDTQPAPGRAHPSAAVVQTASASAPKATALASPLAVASREPRPFASYAEHHAARHLCRR